MNNKNPAPPHARAIISSVDSVLKNPRNPSSGSGWVLFVSINSSGVTTPKIKIFDKKLEKQNTVGP